MSISIIGIVWKRFLKFFKKKPVPAMPLETYKPLPLKVRGIKNYNEE
jgi:hypothetical protein